MDFGEMCVKQSPEVAYRIDLAITCTAYTLRYLGTHSTRLESGYVHDTYIHEAGDLQAIHKKQSRAAQLDHPGLCGG